MSRTETITRLSFRFSEPLSVIWIDSKLQKTSCLLELTQAVLSLTERFVTQMTGFWIQHSRGGVGFTEQEMNQESQLCSGDYRMSTGVWIQRELKTTLGYSVHDTNQKQPVLGNYQGCGHGSEKGRKLVPGTFSVIGPVTSSQIHTWPSPWLVIEGVVMVTDWPWWWWCHGVQRWNGFPWGARRWRWSAGCASPEGRGHNVSQAHEQTYTHTHTHTHTYTLHIPKQSRDTHKDSAWNCCRCIPSTAPPQSFQTQPSLHSEQDSLFN